MTISRPLVRSLVKLAHARVSMKVPPERKFIGMSDSELIVYAEGSVKEIAAAAKASSGQERKELRALLKRMRPLLKELKAQQSRVWKTMNAPRRPHSKNKRQTDMKSAGHSRKAAQVRKAEGPKWRLKKR